MGRQNFVGMVVGKAMEKTIKVRVSRSRYYAPIQKIMPHIKDFIVHDPFSRCNLRDVVRIEACRPVSKSKKFIVTEILKKDETFKYQQPGGDNAAKNPEHVQEEVQ